MKITKNELRRIIKEVKAENLRPEERQSYEADPRPLGGLPGSKSTKEALAFLKELRKEGAADREIVDFMIGASMPGILALEAMQDFKKNEMKAPRKKPFVRQEFEGDTEGEADYDLVYCGETGNPPCPPELEGLSTKEKWKRINNP